MFSGCYTKCRPTMPCTFSIAIWGPPFTDKQKAYVYWYLMLSFNISPVIFYRIFFGFSIKMHWALKGPECILGVFGALSCPLSFETNKLAPLEVLSVSLEGYINSFWVPLRTIEFSWVLIRLLRAEDVPTVYLFLEVLALFSRAVVFCLRS